MGTKEAHLWIKSKRYVEQGERQREARDHLHGGMIFELILD